MKTRKIVLFLLACMQTTGVYARFWSALNHRLAAINFRSAHAEPQLPEDENDKNFWQRLTECDMSADEGKILSLRDVRILKRCSQEKKNKKFIDRILFKNRFNVIRAAREVKATVLALIASVILYKNREILGKRWEQLKDIISGIAIVWLCYTFRHQISNGVSAVTGSLRSALKNKD